MRNLFFILFVFVSAATTQAQKSFVIKGTIKGAKENAKVSLHFDNGQNETIAEAVIKKEKFELKGELTETAMHVLTVEGSSQTLGIFLDPSVVTVTGKIDSLQFAKVKGSKSHDGFLEFKKEFDPYFLRLDLLSKQISNPAMQAKQDSLYTVARTVIENLNTKADEYISTHNQSAVTPLLLYVLYSFFQQPDILEQRFVKLTPESKTSYYGRMVNDIVMEGKIGAVGTPAMNFSQADTSGQMISLTSFKGKYVLIDFWASWCGPCRMENPNVVAAYNRYKSKNFTVLGISLDRDRNAWISAIAKDGLTWTHVSDLKFWGNEVAKMYKITAIPQNLLVNPDGVIIGKNLRGEELQSKLKELFK